MVPVFANSTITLGDNLDGKLDEVMVWEVTVPDRRMMLKTVINGISEVGILFS